MSVTILEALENAQINLIDNRYIDVAFYIGKSQLHNAIILLEKGYGTGTLVDPLLDKYGKVELVPGVEDENRCNDEK